MGCFDEMMKYQACSITDFRLIDRDEDYVDMKTEPAMIATRRFTDDQIRRAAIRAEKQEKNKQSRRRLPNSAQPLQQWSFPSYYKNK